MEGNDKAVTSNIHVQIKYHSDLVAVAARTITVTVTIKGVTIVHDSVVAAPR